MKFEHKVNDHKRKVGIDFGSFGPNSLGILGQSGKFNFIINIQGGLPVNFLPFLRNVFIFLFISYYLSLNCFTESCS